MSHIQSVAGWRTSLCVCGFLSRVWKESMIKTLQLISPLKHDSVSKFEWAITSSSLGNPYENKFPWVEVHRV